MTTIDTWRDFDRLAQTILAGKPALRAMPMDLFRRGNEYILSADLPGIDPSSIDVDIDGQQLTIRAERFVPDSKDVKWLVRERSGGTFVRQLSVGEGIDTSSITASYDDGVLTVTMPVRESAKPRKISVARVSEGEAEEAKVVEA
ncbi:Hsp20/alpha crystallin family protein [Actinomycetaceae bacterium WB03_NA08]|uniref:Hsp20/alpha crystallin family protein n=1 Tax=Scrofimicrobium canadense TaxID=2652290 RepID=A0A6N7W773_9ACTO|nr:Hsp20/alpha crystallin family protein [Scrofimicrobium canadense]MSS84096.1 Hsp20/alpha crystallin family protein [Scrofimicrobium canadense]